MHSTDPSSVYLTLLARMTGGGIADVERALYEDRTLIRLLGMRRTVFVATLDIAPVIQAACSRAVAANERRKLLSWLAESGVGDDVEGWLAEAEQAALAALAARGEATAAELASDDPRLRVQITLARGTKYEGRQNVSSRILLVLAAQGQVVRGRLARLVDLAPVPLGAARAVVPARAGQLDDPGRRGGAGAPLAGRVRPGDARGPAVVGRAGPRRRSGGH